MFKTDLASYGKAPRDDPRSYPGTRPNSSYMFMGDRIEKLKLGNCEPFVSLLERFGIDPASTHAIVGYGSNCSPAQLASKLGKDARNMPMIRGKLYGHDAVYAAGFAAYGSIPTTLAESTGTAVEAWITLMDTESFRVINETEGVGARYHMAELQCDFVMENGERLSPSYAYIHESGALAPDGHPVALSEIDAPGRLMQSATQNQMLDVARNRLLPDGSIDDLVAAACARRDSMSKKLKKFGYVKTKFRKAATELLTVSEMNQ